MRIGSLFSGAGGLDLAVEHVFGAETAWHCEIDPAASKVLAVRWPRVPNLVDITEVNWGALPFQISAVEGGLGVDILCGGYPCQPFSAAGQRKGADDERHLWPYFAEAIRVLRPRYVVLENVAGHRSMGLDQVLADLAGVGYVGSWCSLRASDVGAPHRRERVFILASDTSGVRLSSSCGQSRSDAQSGQRKADCIERSGSYASDSACDGRHQERPQPTGQQWGSDASLSGRGHVELLPIPMSRDHKGASESDMNRHSPNLSAVADLLPTPAASDATGGGSHPDSRTGHTRQLIDYALLATPSKADGDGGHINRSGDRKGELLLPGQVREMVDRWGKYEPAIRRWETLTRPAPPPTEPNKNGNPRLAAPFAEWMMGWAAGWVTDPAIGISRNDQLRIIGNGVVPQQATAALQWLLQVSEAAA